MGARGRQAVQRRPAAQLDPAPWHRWRGERHVDRRDMRALCRQLPPERLRGRASPGPGGPWTSRPATIRDSGESHGPTAAWTSRRWATRHPPASVRSCRVAPKAPRRMRSAMTGMSPAAHRLSHEPEVGRVERDHDRTAAHQTWRAEPARNTSMGLPRMPSGCASPKCANTVAVRSNTGRMLPTGPGKIPGPAAIAQPMGWW